MLGKLHALLQHRLLQESAIYMATNALCALFPLVLIPIMARLLPPAAYGMVGNFLSITAVLAVLLGLNLDQSLRRDFVKPTYKNTAPDVLTTLTLTIGLALCVGLALVLVPAFRQFVQTLTALPAHYLGVALLTGWAMFLFNLGSLFANARHKPLLYALIRLLQVMLYAGCAIGFLLFWHKDAGDVMLARGLSYLLVGLPIVALILWRFIPLTSYMPRPTTLRKHMWYALPLIPAVFQDAALTFTDRAALTAHSGLLDAGLYAFAYQLAQPMQLFTSTLGLAFYPTMLRLLEDTTPTAQHKNRLILLGGMGVIVLCGLCYILVLPFLIPLLGHSDYTAATPLTPWLVLAFMLGGSSALLANIHLHAGTTSRITFAALCGLGLNLLGNHWAAGDALLTVQSTAAAYGLGLLLLYLLKPKR